MKSAIPVGKAIVVALLAVAVAGCASTITGTPETTTAVATSAAPSTPAGPVLPPEPQPTANGPCPYLPTGEVEEANGQRVSKVRISADTPHPTCFFYRADGSVQLTVRTYVGEPAVAKLVVDTAAPVDSANPADSPAGWQGGAQRKDDGAVYAVAKGGAAVVVTTNQQQTIKARRITEQTIAALGL